MQSMARSMYEEEKSVLAPSREQNQHLDDIVVLQKPFSVPLAALSQQSQRAPSFSSRWPYPNRTSLCYRTV